MPQAVHGKTSPSITRRNASAHGRRNGPECPHSRMSSGRTDEACEGDFSAIFSIAGYACACMSHRRRAHNVSRTQAVAKASPKERKPAGQAVVPKYLRDQKGKIKKACSPVAA